MGLFGKTPKRRSPEQIQSDMMRAQADWQKSAAEFRKRSAQRFPKYNPDALKKLEEKMKMDESRVRALQIEMDALP